MENIKVRAWDISKKKYHYPKLWDNTMPSNWEQHYILELYTGLKDKHGKEIYCGDLYRTELTEKPRQVFFKNGAFCGGFTFDNCAPLAWDCEHDEDTCNELYPCNTEYIEIIGNIHSNLEWKFDIFNQIGTFAIDANTLQTNPYK